MDLEAQGGHFATAIRTLDNKNPVCFLGLPSGNIGHNTETWVEAKLHADLLFGFDGAEKKKVTFYWKDMPKAGEKAGNIATLRLTNASQKELKSWSANDIGELDYELSDPGTYRLVIDLTGLAYHEGEHDGPYRLNRMGIVGIK